MILSYPTFDAIIFAFNYATNGILSTELDKEFSLISLFTKFDQQQISMFNAFIAWIEYITSIPWWQRIEWNIKKENREKKLK